MHLTETLSRCAQVSRDGAVHFVCTDWRDMDAVLTAGKRVYGEPVNLCVWTKAEGRSEPLYRSEHELIFVFRVGQAPPAQPAKRGKEKKARSNVWTYPAARVQADGSNARAADAAAKPIALIVDALEDVTKPGDLILDVALGPGTTLVAAERSGRRLRGLEADPAWVDVAVARWRALTGGTPVLATEAAR